jgi:UrcA family protein
MTIHFMNRSAAVLAGSAAALVFAIPPASAQESPIVVQGVPVPNMRIERVSFYDLNLASRAGEQALMRRVSQAIERVCLYDNGRWYGMSEPSYNQCSWGAWARARPQMIGAISRARAAAYYAAYRRY